MFDTTTFFSSLSAQTSIFAGTSHLGFFFVQASYLLSNNNLLGHILHHKYGKSRYHQYQLLYSCPLLIEQPL